MCQSRAATVIGSCPFFSFRDAKQCRRSYMANRTSSCRASFARPFRSSAGFAWWAARAVVSSAGSAYRRRSNQGSLGSFSSTPACFTSSHWNRQTTACARHGWPSTFRNSGPVERAPASRFTMAATVADR